MTLLFDQNLSFRLVNPISRFFAGSRHVREFGLARADDKSIWEFARQHDFAIVTLDSDFHERCLLQGWPPKIIWLRTGNTSTAEVQAMLLSRIGDITAFLSDADSACLVIAR